MKILGILMNWVLNLLKTTMITIDGFSFSLMSVMIWGMVAFFVGVLVFSFFSNK